LSFALTAEPAHGEHHKNSQNSHVGLLLLIISVYSSVFLIGSLASSSSR
jgi:hypothetical protein